MKIIMEGCILKKNNFESILVHCNWTTRAAVASTCRYMRDFLNASPLFGEWADLSVYERMVKVLETGMHEEFFNVDVLQEQSRLSFWSLLLLCVRHKRFGAAVALLLKPFDQSSVDCMSDNCFFYLSGRTKSKEWCEYLIKHHLSWGGLRYLFLLQGAASTGDEHFLHVFKQIGTLFDTNSVEQKLQIQMGFLRAGICVNGPTSGVTLLGDIESARDYIHHWMAKVEDIFEFAFKWDRPELVHITLELIQSKKLDPPQEALQKMLYQAIIWCNMAICKRVIAVANPTVDDRALCVAYVMGRLDMTRFFLEHYPHLKTLETLQAVLHSHVDCVRKNHRLKLLLERELEKIQK